MKNIKILSLIKYLLFCSIFFSFITYNFKFGDFFFLKYLTISEVFGIPSVLLFAFYAFKNRLKFEEINPVYKSALLLFLSLSIGILVASDIKSTLVAIFILGYLILYSITTYFVFRNDFLPLLKTIFITMIVLSIFAFYDNLAVTNGYLPIFKNASTIHLSSGFRYFGQLGDYTFMILTFLIPYQFSTISKNLDKKWYIVLRMATFLGFITMIGSCRISSILSICIGFILWFFSSNKASLLAKFKVEFILLFAIIATSQYTFPNISKNLLSRFDSRISNRVEGTAEADFVMDNFTFAIKSFQEKPLFGNGLASIKNPGNDLEIHGTYLKLLAETGIFGVFFYLIFLVIFGYALFNAYKIKNNSTRNFLKNYFPFLIASLIFWSYEYHLRKKEFWLFLALMLIVAFNNKDQELYNRI